VLGGAPIFRKRRQKRRNGEVPRSAELLEVLPEESVQRNGTGESADENHFLIGGQQQEPYPVEAGGLTSTLTSFSNAASICSSMILAIPSRCSENISTIL
jgi:hypothetical protein